MMGGFRDVRRACVGLLESVRISLDGFFGLCKNGGGLGLF